MSNPVTDPADPSQVPTVSPQVQGQVEGQISLNDTPVQTPFSLNDPSAINPPSEPIAQDRAKRIDYGLGALSDGVISIKDQLSAGQEPQLRQRVAANQDYQDLILKNQLVRTIADKNGGNLTPDLMQAVDQLNSAQLHTDPGTVLEQKFAEKYIDDVTKIGRIQEDQYYSPTTQQDTQIGRGMTTWHQYAMNGLQNLTTEYENQSVAEKVREFAVGLVPILPWYRQAQALQSRPTHLENWGMGETVADNVAYLYSLPLDQRTDVYDKAIAHIKATGNLSDALMFAQAMVSFATSDRYLGNATSIADYSTIGAPVVGKLLKGVPKFVTPLEGTEPAKLLQITQENRLLLEDQTMKRATGSNLFNQQPDLFGAQPDQGAFRFMNDAEQATPILESKLPPGKLRATFQPEEPFSTQPVFRGEGGRMQANTNAMTQRDLPLGPGGGEPPAQGSLFLQGGSNKRPPPPGGPGGGAAVSAQEQTVKQVMADGVKVLEGTTKPEEEAILSSVGDTQQSGMVGALKKLADSTTEGLGNVADQMSSLLDGENWLRGSKVLGRNLIPELGAKLTDEGNKLVGTFLDMLRVNRLTPEALQAAQDNAKLALSKDFGRLGRAVRTVRYTPAEMHAANVDTMSYIVGRPDGALFESENQARLFRDQHYQIGQEGIVRPQGRGWYIEIPRTLDEGQVNVLKAMDVAGNQSNTSVSNILGRFVRTAKDIVSPFQSENRNIATHSPQKIQRAMVDVAKENIGSLPKASRQRVNDMLVINRDTAREEGQPRGFWYRNAGEFEQAFLERHGVMPTAKEVIAYDTYHRLQDLELLMENVSIYRDKARLGIRQGRFTAASESGGKTVSPWFEGKSIDEFPWRSVKEQQDATIWVQDGMSGKGKFYYAYNTTAEERKYIDDLIANRGHRVFQIAEPTKHPLEGLAKTAAGEKLSEPVNYVISNAFEHKPLSWEQVNYREGPHSIYQHKYYVSQPQIKTGRGGRATYFGDNNALNVKTEAQAKIWAEKLDTGRKLLRNGDIPQLTKYLNNETVYSLDQFMDLFRRHDSPFSLDHQIVYKERGRSTIDTVATLKKEYAQGNLVDARKNIHDLSNMMDKSFLMDRDEVINTVNEKTWQLGPAAQLDPYVALNQVIGQRVRNVWSNDYKISHTISWLQQFEHVMEPAEKTLLGHPMHFLYHPQYKAVGEAAMGDLAAAKATRAAIINFIGAKSELSNAMDAFKMRMLNSVYSLAGDGKLLDMAIATTADPAGWMRAIAFHSKLGFFNPVQLFLQANQMYHAIAVSGPRNGISGFTAAFLMRRLAHNPDALDRVAQTATHFGWSVPEFKEMYAAFQRTGLYEVAGEAALRNDNFDPHIFRTKLGGFFLDSGAMFFNEGERLGRLTAFATAYKDYRKVNKAGELGNREIATILNRSDDLSGNMTTGSKAAWQNGIWSVPTQFATWNARMMEQMIGGAVHDITGGAIGSPGRLTGTEKLRALAMYSLLYGAPMGLGVTVGGVWPMYDSIKKEGMARGINMNDGYFEPFTEGLLETAIHHLTGHQYNISQRYSPGNQTLIRDALDGDKSLPQLLLGASGTIVGDFLKASAPFYYYTASIFSDTGEFPLQSSDWMTVARNLNTVDMASKMAAVAAYSKWITKTGTVVDDKVDGMDAFMIALGLSPLRVSDTFLLQKQLKEAGKDKTSFQNEAIQILRRGYAAGGEGDYEAMQGYMKQARTIMEASDMNIEQINQAYQKAASQLETLGNKVRWDAIKQSPKSRYQQNFNTYAPGAQ